MRSDFDGYIDEEDLNEAFDENESEQPPSEEPFQSTAPSPTPSEEPAPSPTQGN